jgi:hypothetical protein
LLPVNAASVDLPVSSANIFQNINATYSPSTSPVTAQISQEVSEYFYALLADGPVTSLSLTSSSLVIDIPAPGSIGPIIVSAGINEEAPLDELFTDVTNSTTLGNLIVNGPGIVDLNASATIGNLEVATGANLRLLGGTLTTDPVTVDNGGNIFGYGTITGDETANGIVTASGGTLDITGNVSGTGTLTFGAGAALLIEGTVSATENLIFNAPNELLNLGSAADVLSAIGGIGSGDFIALEAQTVTSALYDSTDDILVVTGSGGGTYDLALSGLYQQSNFSVVGGKVEVACFASGTHIESEHGASPVEQLAVGDMVRAGHAGLAPIKWIGHRHIDCRRHRQPHDVWPVRISRDAFDAGTPCRDLWLSPDHAVFFEGALIPIKHLINNATVRQEQRDQVTYWHVELARHDLLLAEGLPCESYLDTGNRNAFANRDVVALHPSFGRTADSAWSQDACAPLIESGPALAAARDHLAERAEALGYLASGAEVVLDAAGYVCATIGAGVETVSLISEACRLGDDRRLLGALVTGLRIDSAEIVLDDPRLMRGFHEIEIHGTQAVRWTDGTASFAIGRGSRERLIEIQVATVSTAQAEHRAA